MKKLIRMFNEFWAKDREMPEMFIDYAGELVCEEDIPADTVNIKHHPHELFFNPTYKWFEAMRWKERGEMYSMVGDEKIREKPEWPILHRTLCAGKTAEEIIEYCIKNTED